MPHAAHRVCPAASRALRPFVASACVVVSFVVGSETSARAEGPLAKPDYVPQGEYFPKGTWAAGFGATIESSAFEGRDPAATTTRSSRYGLTSRNGYFLADRFLIGLRARYDVALRRVTLPSVGGAPGLVIEGSEQSFEVGPWFRYYAPVGNGWAIFGEADWSYRTYYDEEKGLGSSRGSESTGRGLAFGAGGGITYFLTKGVAFDVAGRASFARLLVRSDGRRTRLDLADFGLVLGFQIYLPEFVF